VASVLTNSGRSVLIQRLLGLGTEPKQIGWGTGAGTAAATDTTLFSEVALDGVSTTGSRTAATSSQVTTDVTGDTYQLVATKTAAGSCTITNVGAWDNSAIGSGNLFIKGDHSAYDLEENDSITYTIKLQAEV
jgi:hypothetical protein